jgi:hypothetical protein
MPGLVAPMLLFTVLYVGLGSIVVALVAAMVRETAVTVVPDPTSTPTGAPAGGHP